MVLRYGKKMSKRQWLFQGGTFLFFGIMAGFVLNNLLFQFNTAIPGPESDFYHFHWNYWWARYAIFELNHSVFFTDYIHVPFEQNLAYHTLTLIWLPLYLIFEPLIGQIATLNSLLWLNITLSGYITFVFLRAETIPNTIALGGGVLMASSSYMIDHLWAFHLNLMALFWLPLTALLWHQLCKSPRLIYAVILGFAFWLLWLTDLQWLLWIPFFLIPYGVMKLLQVSGNPPRLRLVGLGLLSISIMAILAWVIGPYRQMMAWEGYVQPATIESARYWSLPLESLWGESPVIDQQPNQVLGKVTIVLVGIAILIPSKNHWRWLWLGTGGIALVLALGPEVMLNGEKTEMPYLTLHHQLDGIYRAPVRFLPIVYLSAMMFVGLSLKDRFKHLSFQWHYLFAMIVIGALLIDHQVFRPIPIYQIPTYDLYEDIRRDDTDVVVVEVPISVANGWNAVGDYWAIDQYYGIQHQKRMVSGFVARENSNNYLFYELSPLWHWLAGKRGLDYVSAFPEWDKYLTEFPIGYVIVHQDHFGKDHPTTLEWLAFLNTDNRLCLIKQENQRIVYRSIFSSSGCPFAPTKFIDVGEPMSDLGAFGFGWYWEENFGGQTSRWMGQEGNLYAAISPDVTKVVFQGLAFQESRIIQVYLEGELIGTVEITTDGWQTFSLPLPLPIPTDLRSHLRFVSDQALSPAALGLSGDTRALSVAMSWVAFE